MFRQLLDPTGNLWLSFLLGAVPLAVLLLLLAGVRMKAHWASLITLGVGLVLAVSVWKMPLAQAASAAADGLAQGTLAILWLTFNAIWIHNMTVESGHFDTLRETFAGLSSDLRVATILIAFAFGALLEALAGGGAPVAICAVMLISLGVGPIKAVVAALVADTAPVAFGGMGNPLTILGRSVQLSDGSTIPAESFAAMAGRQTSILSVLVPFVLLVIIDGRRGLKQVWPAALAAGLSFGLAQYALSNHFSYQLTDIFSALVATAAVIVLGRFWRPREEVSFTSAKTGDRPATAGARLLAFSPYIAVIAVFSLAQIPAVKKLLELGTVTFGWPGLDVADAAGHQVKTQFVANFASATGSLLLVAAIITMFLLRISPSRALAIYGRVLKQFGWAIVTILAVFALSYLMNYSGMIVTMGVALATTGAAFAFLSPIVGWVGVFITGTDAGANAMFGQLQATAAQQIGASPVLFGAANTTGGVMGKMISPQNLAVGAAAINMVGSEGDILRKVIGWSMLFLALTCILVFLQSTPVLAWMVVGG